jgi:Cu+-exporting ATPase
MRIHTIVCAAIAIVIASGCSAELAQRTPANDPTSAASAEAPFRQPPAYEPDPLLSPVPPKSPEPPPTGAEQTHSPTSTSPGNPPLREEPGGHPPAHHPEHGGAAGAQHEPEHAPAATVYTCPMHPEVRQAQPGKCPKCGMTLVPAAPKDDAR